MTVLSLLFCISYSILAHMFRTIPESSSIDQVDFLLSKAKLTTKDTICDPFAGAGIVGLQAALKGIRSINIELDREIFLIMKSNFRKLDKSIASFANLIYGDSETVEINEKLSAIITSPPYTLSQTLNPPISINEYKEYIQKLGRIFKKFFPLLLPDARVVVLIGRDRFKNKIIPIHDIFTKEMIRIGYKLLSSKIREGSTRKTKIIIFTKRIK